MTLPRPGTAEERVQFLRYTDPARWPVLGRFPVPDRVIDEVVASMIGGTPDDVHRAGNALVDRRARGVTSLLDDAEFRGQLKRLPFGAGDRVVAVGDSITADRVGWFELLAAALELSGDDVPVLVNTANSGDTTADVLARFDQLEATRPSHVLLMLGTNDARAHGRTRRHPMASRAESGRNLRAIIDLVTVGLGATVTVLTPPACDVPRASRFFADLPLGWSAADIDAVAAVVRDLGAPCVDVHAFTAARPPAETFDDDGIHLSASAQVELARFVVAELAELAGLPEPADGATRPGAQHRAADARR